MNVVQELESRFLSVMRNMAQEIEVEFPNIKTNVWSHSIGALTKYQGHDIGIECLLPDTSLDQSDNIALSISVKHITTIPKIDSVDVCWGHPSGHIEAELFTDEVEFNDDNLKLIADNLPILFGSLKAAIKRGHPSDDE